MTYPLRTSRKRTGCGGWWVWKSVAAEVSRNSTSGFTDVFDEWDRSWPAGAGLQATRTNVVSSAMMDRMRLTECAPSQAATPDTRLPLHRTSDTENARSAPARNATV